jgi:hypothetical protein
VRRREQAEERRRRTIEKKMLKRRLEFYRPILEDWRQNKMGDDIVEVVKLASEVTGPSRERLAQAFLRLGTPAEGERELHAIYQAIAAEALAMCDRVRPRNQRTIPVQEEEREPVAIV